MTVKQCKCGSYFNDFDRKTKEMCLDCYMKYVETKLD